MELTTANVNADIDVHLITRVSDPQGLSSADTMLIQVREVLAIDPFADVIPVNYELQQNFPNPFNPSTQIRFGLPKSSDVRVDIINVLGQRVATLVNGRRPAGYHVITFDARDIASGIYFYHIKAHDTSATSKLLFESIKKMILLK